MPAPLNREETLEKLKPYFQLGMSITKACESSEVCDDQTILNWIKEDESISSKIKAWQNYVSARARENIASAINDRGDIELSKWWLERKEKKEFSSRTEVTGEDGKSLGDDSVKKIAEDLHSLVTNYGITDKPASS